MTPRYASPTLPHQLPDPCPAAKAAALQSQAQAAAAQALEAIFPPLAAAEHAARSLAGLELVPQPIRDRAARLAAHIETETAGILLLAGRRP